MAKGVEKVSFPDDWIETNVTINIPMKSKEEGPKAYILSLDSFTVLLSNYGGILWTTLRSDYWMSFTHLTPGGGSGQSPEAAERAWLFIGTCHIEFLPLGSNCNYERYGLMCMPLVFTPKSLFGSLVVRAHEYIYNKGNIVDGSKVECTLGYGSWVPTINQFAQKLSLLGLDPFHMLALFTHFIKLLYTLPGGSQLVAKLDTRFRQILTFGNGIIQKFANNTSEMKRFLCYLLFCIKLADLLSIIKSNRLRVKVFNLSTYKFHAMADYVRTIRLF
ncbi:hypothetical protein BDR06DRAFT_968449 [Suillus hirtellus]|nr:hypothetical protein BDR06DRAFT_968449 [Suillus hirtellus]